jgi:sterol 3beta-glucosyltransferase
VLSTSVSLLAAPIAEAHRRPLVTLALQPVVPTRTHGPALLGGRDLGPWLNEAVPAAFTRVGLRVFAGIVRDVRRELDLPDTPAPGYRHDELPVLHGISPTVYPRPADWRDGADVAGYWWPPDDWEPDPVVAEFLAAGPAPVYVGFGSMGAERASQVGATVSAALHATGHRAIVARGWADVAVDGPDVLTVDEVPHAWLFPQVAAVVHHAGAGTTAAGLRAGVPAVPVPFGYDQHFWARRLVELGVAPCSLPARRLDADQLAAALHAALTDPAHRRAAVTTAGRIGAEDGAARVLDVIGRLEATTGIAEN